MFPSEICEASNDALQIRPKFLRKSWKQVQFCYLIFVSKTYNLNWKFSEPSYAEKMGRSALYLGI